MNEQDPPGSSTEVCLSVVVPRAQINIIKTEVRCGETAVRVAKHGDTWCVWRPVHGLTQDTPISGTATSDYSEAVDKAQTKAEALERQRLLAVQLDEWIRAQQGER